MWIQNYTWRTSFPPPLGFVGDEDGDYGDSDYNRQCTPAEWAALDARYPDAFDEQSEPERAADEAIRDAFFAALAEDDEEETGEAEEQEEEETPHPGAHPEPVEGSSETPSDPSHPVPPGPSNDPANPADAPSGPPHPAAYTS